VSANPSESESPKRVQTSSIASDQPQTPATNWILAGLPPHEIDASLPPLDRIVFRANEIVFRPGEPTRYLYFPEDTVISLLSIMEDARSAEVSLTGSEGALDVGGILGLETHCYAAQVEIPGSALRSETKAFRVEFERSGPLQARYLKYMSHLLLQISQTAACNRLHRVRQRLARHLLMIQDRVRRDEFPMTHETLSLVLGTPRSVVSFAAELLHRLGAIDYARGKVIIHSREKLESESCECYAMVHRDFLSLALACHSALSADSNRRHLDTTAQ
jgi:CRP-like cAMP-binding protein